MGNKSFIKNSMDISELLTNFAKEHKIFHSEADFQFKFAWFLKEKNKEYNLILEKPFKVSGLKLHKVRKSCTDGNYVDKSGKIYVDIVVGNVAIELKYKTARLEAGEYNLTKQGAQNDGNTAFENDIKKVTHLRDKKDKDNKNHGIAKGYCIFLTNDEVYWGDGEKKVKKNQLAPESKWCEFSTVGEGENNKFQFYIVEIAKQNSNIIS